MQLTEPQQRTLDQLIGTERPVFPTDLPQRLRDRIEEAARGLELGDPLWLGKERLNDLDRCEGTFWSRLAGGGPPVAPSRAPAGGGGQHRAREVVVGAREPLEAHDAASIAATRTADREERFAEYWRDLGTAEQDALLMEGARGAGGPWAPRDGRGFCGRPRVGPFCSGGRSRRCAIFGASSRRWSSSR